MRPEGMMTFEDAARRLGVSEEGLEELIDAGKLSTRPWMGDVFLDAGEVERREAEGVRREDKPPAPRVERRDARVERIRWMLESGVREVRAREAAELLGILPTNMARLAESGRVNAVRRGRLNWYLLEDVETYARLQGVWASKGGTWTCYGKQEAKVGRSMGSLGGVGGMGVRTSRTPRTPHASHTDLASDADDYRVTTREAAGILELSVPRVNQMVREGKLRGEKVKGGWSFGAGEVYGLADGREARRSRGCVTPGTWRERGVKPFIRTEMAAAQGDRLISRVEAAAILGVGVKRVSALVIAGRLFGWQEFPGRPGCPLLLSERQVVRFGSDPERLRRKAAVGRGPRGESALGEETEGEIWLEDSGLATALRYAEKTTLERQHGEFLNSRQAARELGIAVKSLHDLRSRGGITAYQLPRRKANGAGQKWWFYRREDVDALLLDGEYVRRRDAAQGGRR